MKWVDATDTRTGEPVEGKSEGRLCDFLTERELLELLHQTEEKQEHASAYLDDLYEEKQFAIEHRLNVQEGFSGQYTSAMERMRQLNDEWRMYAEAILEKKGLR